MSIEYIFSDTYHLRFEQNQINEWATVIQQNNSLFSYFKIGIQCITTWIIFIDISLSEHR